MLSVLFIFPLLLLVWCVYTQGVVEGSSGRLQFLSVAGLALLGLMLEFVMNVMGLVGAYKKNAHFLRMYMNYSFVSTVVFTAVCILIIVLQLNSTLTNSNYDAFRSHFLGWYLVVGFISAILQTSTLLMLKTKIYRVKHAKEPNIDFLSEASDDDHAITTKESGYHEGHCDDEDGWASLLDVIQDQSDKTI